MQKLRNSVLEIIHRLPTNPPEAFEPYAEEVVDLLMGLVRCDNEENASLCVKTIMDIMRHQTKVLGEKVQPFLSLIQELFDQMESVVRDQLDNPTSVVPSTPSSCISVRPWCRPATTNAATIEGYAVIQGTGGMSNHCGIDIPGVPVDSCSKRQAVRTSD
jgi:transformation/transcription domain-associated protein